MHMSRCLESCSCQDFRDLLKPPTSCYPTALCLNNPGQFHENPWFVGAFSCKFEMCKTHMQLGYNVLPPFKKGGT